MVGVWLALAACSGDDSDGPSKTDEDPALRVVSVVPEAGAVGVAVGASVVVQFSEPVQAATGTASLGDLEVALSFNAAGDELTLVPVEPFGSLVDVSLELTGFTDVDGQALEEPFRSTFQTELLDRIIPTPRSQTPGRDWAFVDVAAEAGISTDKHQFAMLGGLRASVSSGAATGDYDGDGFVDIFTGRGDLGVTHLYRNRGDGTFEDATASAGVLIDDSSICSPIFVDHDSDGDLDLLAPAFDLGRSRLYRNEGDGTFSEVPEAGGLPVDTAATISATFGDYDQDLDLDLFSARFSVADPTKPRFLFANDGAGNFSDATDAAWLFYLDIQQSFTPNFADMDGDGWPEVLVSSDHGHSVYLRNNGDGTYLVDLDAELTDENGMGATVGDYDNDGDLDWFVAAIYDPNGVTENIWGVLGNRLYQNQGDGSIVDVSEAAGVRDGAWGWGSCFADLDLDGHLDVFEVNGWLDNLDITREEYGKDRSRLFHNDGDGTFTEIGLSLQLDDTTQGRGLACFDYDRDGDIDLFVSPFGQAPRLFRNDSTSHGHFLNVRLQGKAPNTEGVGARVQVTVGGTTQLRELRLGSNYGSNDPVEAHFGLGAAEVIDELVVSWPDGTVSRAASVAVDRFVLVTQP